MFFPGVHRPGFRFPRASLPFGLAGFSIVMTLFAWAMFAPSHVGSDIPYATADASSIRSIAYTLPGEQFDDLVVKPASGHAAPRVVASFPSGGPTGFHARGSASPLGDQVAVLWIPAFATRANLSIVDIASGEVRHVDGVFDSLSSTAWSPDGTRVAATSTVEIEGKKRTSVLEIQLPDLRALPVAEFEGAIEVVPVGYSFESTRLFIVVVDPKGSNLYAERSGKLQFLAELSPGRTRDWALSPDGSRLAYIDVLGGGSRTYVGRTVVMATGAITTLPAEKDQVGASWLPGSPLPAFGGPGGAWQLTDPSPGSAYLVPEDWSPDGAYLVATVYSLADDRSSRPVTVLEVITRETSNTPSSRERVSEAVGAAFIGWVNDLN